MNAWAVIPHLARSENSKFVGILTIDARILSQSPTAFLGNENVSRLRHRPAPQCSICAARVLSQTTTGRFLRHNVFCTRDFCSNIRPERVSNRRKKSQHLDWCLLLHLICWRRKNGLERRTCHELKQLTALSTYSHV